MKRTVCAGLGAILAVAVVLAQVSDPDAVKRRAFALAQAGDYAGARADLERLLAERPDDRAARKLLARVLISANETTEAASHLERLVRTDGLPLSQALRSDERANPAPVGHGCQSGLLVGVAYLSGGDRMLSR